MFTRPGIVERSDQGRCWSAIWSDSTAICVAKKWQHIDIFDINIAVIELLKDELIPLSERLRRAAVAGNRFCPRKAASSCPASWSEGPMGPSVTSTLRPRMHGEIPPKITGSISGLVEGTFFSCNFPLNL